MMPHRQTPTGTMTQVKSQVACLATRSLKGDDWSVKRIYNMKTDGQMAPCCWKDFMCFKGTVWHLGEIHLLPFLPTVRTLIKKVFEHISQNIKLLLKGLSLGQCSWCIRQTDIISVHSASQSFTNFDVLNNAWRNWNSNDNSVHQRLYSSLSTEPSCLHIVISSFIAKLKWVNVAGTKNTFILQNDVRKPEKRSIITTLVKTVHDCGSVLHIESLHLSKYKICIQSLSIQRMC